MNDHPRVGTESSDVRRASSLREIRSTIVSQLIRLADRPIGLMLAAMGAIVFSLLAAGRGPDRDSHDAVLTALRTIDLANSSMQRDVLQARSGYLNNYDPLVSSVIKLHSMMDVLSSEKMTLVQSQGEALVRLQSSISTIEEVVERFKTNNALLQNSLRIFTVKLTDLRDSSDAAPLPTGWMEIGNLMMLFLTHPEPDLGRRIDRLLSSVDPAQVEGRTRLKALEIHGQEILRVQPVVDRLVAEIQASSVSLRTQELQAAYLFEFGEITRDAYWGRAFLGAVAVGLCIYILFLAYRLRRQSDRLARRLRFEHSRSVIKAVFDDDSSSGGTEAIRLGMKEISDLFSASGYTFVLVNTESANIEERYQDSPPAADIPNLVAEYIRTVGMPSSDGIARGRPFYMSLHSHGDLAFSRDALSAGSAVGVPFSRKNAAIMVLEYSEGRQRPSSDDILLMQDSLELMARCLDRLRKNQERDLLENRLAHSERLLAVGTLAAGIAHEFNNILVFMLGYGEMALQLVRKPVAARRYIEGICSAGERARHIIDQILALSRKRERDVWPFDLREVVAETLSLLSVTTRYTDSIGADLPDEPIVILGNPVELQQIIVNLCNNAMEVTSGEGHVVIDIGHFTAPSAMPMSHGVLPPGSYVRLSVADDGPGISESAMPHIFEPFFTTRPLAGGTGLGLATVHGYVVAHDGFADVTTILGTSTRFDLYFPASHLAPLRVNEELNRDDLVVGNGQTILLLERDEALRLMYEEKIAALSYEPIGFSSLSEVEDWFKAGKQQPEIALIDVASLEPQIGKSEIRVTFESTPYLLIVDPQRLGSLQATNLNDLETIRKPIDLRSLATRIERIIRLQRRSEPAADRNSGVATGRTSHIAAGGPHEPDSH